MVELATKVDRVTVMGPSLVAIAPRDLTRAVRDERACRPDVVIAAKEEPVTLLLAWTIGAPIRVGYREGGLGFLLTHYLPIRGGRPQHRELAALAGPAGADAAPPVALVKDAAHEEVEGALRSPGFDETLPTIVVHPGSGDPRTRWPWSRFAEALDLVSAQRPLLVCLVGAGELEPRPVLYLPAPSRVLALDAPLSIAGLASLLASADLFLGNESGPSHLAAAVGTHAVVPFLSGNDPRRWGPAAPHGRVVEGPRGMGPDAEDVAQAILELLSGSGGPGFPAGSGPAAAGTR